MPAQVTARPRARQILSSEALRRAVWPTALAVLFTFAFALRLDGLGAGLPYVYNVDEQAHFVPRAIGFFGHDYDPRYFVNPPGFTYLLHTLFWVWFGGGDGATSAYARDPGDVFVVARAASAVLGAAAVVLVALAGARLFDDRRAGFVAGVLLACAFLPAFYGRLALNDAPALAPVALALYGSAGVLRDGRRRDFALAGLGFGLAAATKYTAGIVVLPLIAATLLGPRERRVAVARLAGALLLALAAFVAANPYALLTPDAFLRGLTRQAHAAGAVEKLGISEENGWRFYAEAATWGLGWAPALAAVAGAVLLFVRRADRHAAWLLVPCVLGFWLFMGQQERYFGRWLMPVLPVLCLLAGVAVVRAADAAAARLGRRRLGGAFVAALAAGLAAQGLVHTVHGGRVLSRADTRELARAWMAEHVPRGARIVVEPVVADGWLVDSAPGARLGGGDRWIDIAARDAPTGELSQGGLNPRLPLRRAIGTRPLVRLRRSSGVVGGENHQRTLSPDLLDRYAASGACWVVTGSTQEGRALADPDLVPQALAYYRALRSRGELVFRASPYREGHGPVPFDFDMSFNAYRLAYERPGPVISVYRLGFGGCVS